MMIFFYKQKTAYDMRISDYSSDVCSSALMVAAIFQMMNHATFKASLFMAAGIIDHEVGARDIRRLSRLYRLMPGTAMLATIAAAAMAGVPLLNGFLSKEMFFAETIEQHVTSLQIGRAHV